MEDNISLYKLVKAFKKRIVLNISLVILIVTATGLVSHYLLPRIYEASTQILISKKESGQSQINSQDIQTNLQLIDTYSEIIKSPVILSQVIENLNLQTTPDLLAKKIVVTSKQNSQILSVVVEDRELSKAVVIANMIAEVFQNDVKALMNVDNVTILSPAINQSYIKPISPNLPLNLVIATAIGLIIGVGLTFTIEYFDSTVKTEQEIHDLIGISILGLVSPITLKKTKNSKRKEVGKKR